VGRFGSMVKGKLTSPVASGQSEDQLRAPIELLVRDLAGLCDPKWYNGVALVGETSASGLKARPDYAVTLAKVLVGFIELKAPGKGADPRLFRGAHDKRQWEQLKCLPNLIYTDGSEFALWRDGELVGSVVRLSGDLFKAGVGLVAPPALLKLVEEFLRWSPTTPRTAKELAAVSARLCRLLREEVEEHLTLGSPGLKSLGKAWRKALFPNATNKQFADGYAQAVTFGMLMARARGIPLDDIRRAAQQLGDTLIGAALRVLTFSDKTSQPITSIRTLSQVIDAVDWERMSAGSADAWLYFYEDFLAEYDGALRKQTGSYYTPAEVVTEMVRLVDDALRKRFKLPDGLASHSVVIADPAAGTGTFLLGVLRKIAQVVTDDLGEGAVPSALDAAVRRLIGFDVQLGPFAVAQLRILAELRSLMGDAPSSNPRLYVADTLANPYMEQEWLGPILDEIADSRRKANEIKRDERIMVVLGNPPYRDRAKDLGGWIVDGDAGSDPVLLDWIPPAEWKQGAHVRHLHNLYVYFWRWATWKAFDQYPDANTGIVCFVSSAAFLNGPGFDKMRDHLRRTADEIWVVDCTPEGHQPEVSTRFFEGVQRPICVVLACRYSAPQPLSPAKVRFRALPRGSRSDKFEALSRTSLDDKRWEPCPTAWRAPFRPTASTSWDSYPSLNHLFEYNGTGSMIGRTWPVAPDRESLERRWRTLTAAPIEEMRELFQPHLVRGKPADRHTEKALRSGLPGFEYRPDPVSEDRGPCVPPTRYAFRSFDRQYIIPDNRLINRPNPTLWGGLSDAQVYITAPMDRAPTAGPAVTVTGFVPDAHHYNGRGGRVFMLWRDAEASEPNVRESVTDHLSRQYDRGVDGEDLFAYVVAVTSHPAFTERFKADMAKPGVRVPLTGHAALFFEAVRLGREVIWTQTFGERFVDPDEGRPRKCPRVTSGPPPRVPKGYTIAASDDFPDELRYDADNERLYVGDGRVDNVPPEVWEYEVSGKHVVRQWFSYRDATRDRPQHTRRDSALSDVIPDRWPHEYTAELLKVLNVLGRLAELEADQADLLDRVCSGTTIDVDELRVERQPRSRRLRRSEHPAQAKLPLGNGGERKKKRRK